MALSNRKNDKQRIWYTDHRQETHLDAPGFCRFVWSTRAMCAAWCLIMLIALKLWEMHAAGHAAVYNDKSINSKMQSQYNDFSKLRAILDMHTQIRKKQFQYMSNDIDGDSPCSKFRLCFIHTTHTL